MKKIGKLLVVLILLYLFLCSIGIMGAGFKKMGKGFVHTLIQTTTNPFVGLIIGILATTLVQSSSVTTSITVGLVSSGVLSIHNAVPIVMGANIGTTVTNTIVSLIEMPRDVEFKRAFSAAVIHDFFNFTAVLILFPLQYFTGFLNKIAYSFASLFASEKQLTFHSPVKASIKPVVKFILHTIDNLFSSPADYIVTVVFSIFLLIFSLSFLVKILRKTFVKYGEIGLNNVLKKSPVLGIIFGMGFTFIVQSSSVTTSILIPLAGAGVITLQNVFPITVGANIGTTITAIIASLAGNFNGLAIALVHLLFNLIATFLIFGIPLLRQTIIKLSERFGELAAKNKFLPIFYVIVIFYLLPLLIVLTGR